MKYSLVTVGAFLAAGISGYLICQIVNQIVHNSLITILLSIPGGFGIAIIGAKIARNI